MIGDATVDPREVEFYRNLAAFWWDQTGPLLLASGGLEVAAQSGVAVNPFNRNFYLSRRMNVNYMLAAGQTGSATECTA